MTGRRQNSINSGDDEHCRHHRRKDEALILQRHLGKGWKFLELKSKAAESWKHKAREFAYDIVGLLLLVLVKLCSAREFAYDIVSLLLLVLVKLCRVFKISGSICVASGKPSKKSDEPNERFLQMGTHATNETHASPIAQQSTATPILTPNQTQQATNETLASPIAQQSIETPVSLEGNFSH
ncbi:hypothetical protein F2Q70_00043499 [Brassica cretica]|uniref:Uncharacterized protein n=1 Tax=Brassica cretica TaxID=69181 RepID=A0A8S9KJY2_BRACR|nr:hypothetical protein F2Q70_00043499 [Brassica cretica]KAF2605990.1 hypothetical protein F2Q68_00044501 [Brassica cretica]